MPAEQSPGPTRNRDQGLPRWRWTRRGVRTLRWAAARPRLLLWGAATVGVLLVAAMVAPLGDLVAGLLRGLGSILQPLYETPTGRLVALNLLLLGLVMWGLGALRASLRTLRGDLLLRRHLQGIQALGGEQDAAAAACFERVARSRGPVPATFPEVRYDAALKLARRALEQGEPAAAHRQLRSLRERDLPDALRPSWRLLSLRAEWQLGNTIASELVADAEAALRSDPPTVPLCELLAELRHAAGDLAGAVEVRQRAVEVAPGPRSRRAAERQLVDELCRAAELALAADPPRLDEVVRYAELARGRCDAATDPRPWHLLAEVALRRNQLRTAISTWAEARSERGLQAIAELLDDAPRGTLTAREFLELCPLEAAIVLAAQLYLQAGEVASARRAVQRADHLNTLPDWLAERLAGLRNQLAASR